MTQIQNKKEYEIKETQNPNNKIFKDSSEFYKSSIPDVVDKVYNDIQNHEGYEIKKMRIRSDRIPIIGDKYCSGTVNKSFV